jgi:hypothetical protein
LSVREGCQARSKALDLGSSLEGVQGFESLPSHQDNSDVYTSPISKTPMNQGFSFTKHDVEIYYTLQLQGLSQNHIVSVKNIIGKFYEKTHGKINQNILIEVSNELSASKYSYVYIKKFYIYINNFIKYLGRAYNNPMLLNMTMYMRCPKNKRTIKLMTVRVMDSEDITTVIQSIKDTSITDGRKPNWKENYIATILFLAYTGQRAYTTSRLTAGQMRIALASNPPILTVEAEQDKLKMAHYVPLHPVLIPHIKDLIANKQDDVRVFDIFQLQKWLYLHQQPLKHVAGKLEVKDLRKFFEQKSDELGFTDANKNYIMSHGVSSINWTSYKAFLPENVYAVYMKYWGAVALI